MSKLNEYWIELDDQHVKHVQEVIYTKQELATVFGLYANPAPITNSNPAIENTINNKLESN